MSNGTHILFSEANSLSSSDSVFSQVSTLCELQCLTVSDI